MPVERPAQPSRLSSPRRVGPVLALAVACVAGGCEEVLPKPVSTSSVQAVTCRAPARTPGAYRAERAYPALSFAQPTRLVRSPAGRFYVAERAGTVRVFEDREDVAGSTVFVDLARAGRIFDGGIGDGVMGMALHPRFEENGEVFFAFTAPSADARMALHIERGRSLDGGLTLDPSTLEPVLVMPTTESFHHGGPLLFGPDGALYFANGDGNFGDPEGRAQDLGSLFGKVLRLDVDGARPYATPADNPFAGRPGARGEIWALGFRNPWTATFDSSGALWVGDVGQDRWEEINRVERGRNYGWRTMEGGQCYGSPTCDVRGLTAPAFAYSHGEGFSVTLGFVYRGQRHPELRGALIFGDYVTGRVSALRVDEGRPASASPLLDTGKQIVGFAEDGAGEVLVVDFAEGGIHRVVREDRPSEVATRLSQTGCFDTAAGAPTGEFLPYEVNMPLWSDGSEKERWLHVPEGEPIAVTKSGKLEPPPGSIAFKSFRVAGRLVETRMFVHHEESGWVGYSYAWDEDGRDATLLEGGATRDLGGGRAWTFPSRSDCFTCHNLVAGRTLGLTLAQLNRDAPRGPLEGKNQLAALAERRLLGPSDWDSFLADGGPAALPRLAGEGEGEPLEARARAYLDVNCSTCHQQGAPAAGSGDLRATTPLAKADVCAVQAASGPPGVARLAPGAPERSAILLRARSLGADRMPPLASAVVDDRGTAWVEAWIRGLDPAACAGGSSKPEL